jgi:dimethylhistidine N-methyltransferase
VGTALLRAEIVASLSAQAPWLPAKLHYDARGCALFQEICAQPEYDLARLELEIMRRHAGAVADRIGPGVGVIEPGTGDGQKTELLLAALAGCRGYMPIDIGRETLLQTAGRLHARFPDLPVIPLHADFTEPLDLPEPASGWSPRLVYFPGSTIGNMSEPCQVELLASLLRTAGPGGKLLVGFDLLRPVPAMLEAYDDAAGVTAEFNLNVIDRLAGEFGLAIDRAWFEFFPTWDPQRQAVMSWLHALRPVDVDLGTGRLRLAPGERILMEESHKYSAERIRMLAGRAGLSIDHVWNDPGQRFAVVLLSAGPTY